MRISEALAIGLALTALAGCRERPNNAELAKVEAEQVRAAATAGRVPCALGGATVFRLDCTMDRISSAEGQTLVLGRANAGYRRFRVTTDGRGVVSADGAEPAVVTVIGDDQIEIRVGQDRYRLPATIQN
jgi:hypothetical protein